MNDPAQESFLSNSYVFLPGITKPTSFFTLEIAAAHFCPDLDALFVDCRLIRQFLARFGNVFFRAIT